MEILVKRYASNDKATLSAIFIDGLLFGYGCEDEKRKAKVKGETRIPEGTYKIGYRTEGGHHTKYKAKYKDKHFGMLHILDVPNFQYILIHIGNTEKDTDGCLLVGTTPKLDYTIIESTIAYEAFYAKVSDALNKNESVTIKFVEV